MSDDFRDDDWLVKVKTPAPDLNLEAGQIILASTHAENPRAVLVEEAGEHHARLLPCDGKVIAGIVGVIPPEPAS